MVDLGDYQLPNASVLDEREPDPSLLAKLRNWSRATKRSLHFRQIVVRKFLNLCWIQRGMVLGHLYRWHYCGAPETFYCPSHEGEHTLGRM